MTREEIESRLRASGDFEPCRVTGPLAARQNSRLFLAQCGARALAVKICLKAHTEEVDSQAAQLQFETLQRVHRLMGAEAEFSVPTPYLVIPQAGLVAAEWIPGTNLAALVFSWRCSGARARELVARGAQWLRRFHACHAAPPGHLEIEDKLAFMARMESSARIDDALFVNARTCLEASAAAACAGQVARSWVHGDFTADNLMIAGSRVVGIDVDVRFENTVLHDIAPFLNHLELRTFHPDGWPRAVSIEALQRTFVESYQGPDTSPIAVPLAWMRLYMVLQGWISARGKPASPLRRKWVDFSYRTVIGRLMKFLSRQATARAS